MNPYISYRPSADSAETVSAKSETSLSAGVQSIAPDTLQSIHETALKLRGLNYSPIWLKGKKPFAFGWSNLPNQTAEELTATFKPGYNLGVRCGKWSTPKAGHGLVIVDVDVSDTKYIDIAYAKLNELTGGVLGRGVVTGSRKGGHHYWFTCPLDKLPAGSRTVLACSDETITVTENGAPKQKRAWAIEVLSTGAQAVTPPSIHPVTGQAYVWENERMPLDDLPVIPEQLLNLLHKSAKSAKHQDHSQLKENHPLGACLFIQHCQKEAASLSEPFWHAAGCNLAVTDGGREFFHKISEPYPGYSQKETDDKLDCAVKADKPHTCEAIARLGYRCANMDEGGTCLVHGGRAPAVFAQPKLNKADTISAQLAGLVDGSTLCHDSDGYCYVRIRVGSHTETWPVRSQGFRRWLMYQYYENQRKAAGSQAMEDAIRLIEAKAQFEGVQINACRRVAPHDTGIVIDLCDPDWRAVRIDQNGWDVVSGPHDFPLVRTRGMLPLPLPVRGGSLHELWDLVNIPAEAHPLVAAWLLATLRPVGPYPILVLQGEHGSAKSSTAQILRNLVDPHTTPLRSPPKDEHDLVIAAKNSRVVCLDNLSGVQPWMSDALCRLATGGGFSRRQLYTDDEEMLFEVQRPILLNGIDDIATRQDLLDRTLIVHLPTIPDAQRRTEDDIENAFAQAKPRILGALFDSASGALRNLPNTDLGNLPRMADFALWATAGETALGFEPGSFMEAYSRNQRDATELSLEQDSVANAIASLTVNGQITGNAKEVLERLKNYAGEGTFGRLPPDWPQTPKGLANRLRRLTPALRMHGIQVEFCERSHGKNRIEIRNTKHEDAETKLLSDAA